MSPQPRLSVDVGGGGGGGGLGPWAPSAGVARGLLACRRSPSHWDSNDPLSPEPTLRAPSYLLWGSGVCGQAAAGSEGEDAGNDLPKPRDRPGTLTRLLPETCQAVGVNPADPATARGHCGSAGLRQDCRDAVCYLLLLVLFVWVPVTTVSVSEII